MITCPTCNTQNEVGAAFCDQCGASLAAMNAAAAPGPASAAGGKRRRLPGLRRSGDERRRILRGVRCCP